jgi:hypothetical protein
MNHRFLLLPFLILALCALFAPIAVDAAAPVWLRPDAVACPQTCRPGNLDPEAKNPTHIGVDTGVWRSEGYDPGTEWPTRAFACAGQHDPNGWQTVWHGFDDDHVAGGVWLGGALNVSGFQYITQGKSGGPPPYAHFLDLFLSADGIHWTQVAHHTDDLKFGVWTPEQATFTARPASYLYWFSEDEGTWPTVGLAKVLTDSTTQHAC